MTHAAPTDEHLDGPADAPWQAFQQGGGIVLPWPMASADGAATANDRGLVARALLYHAPGGVHLGSVDPSLSPEETARRWQQLTQAAQVPCRDCATADFSEFPLVGTGFAD